MGFASGMPPGWVVYVVGALISAGGLLMGGFVIYLGSQLNTAASDQRPQVTAASTTLSAQQSRLLRILYQTEVMHGARKLIVIRKTGEVFHEPGENTIPTGVNLLAALYLAVDDAERAAHRKELEALIEDFPSDFLERMPNESRWDNPFVVRLTKDGIEYAKQLPDPTSFRDQEADEGALAERIKERIENETRSDLRSQGL